MPDGAIILLYHGVTRSKPRGIENYSGKHIRAEIFEKQMEYLSHHTSVMSLRELTRRIEEKTLLPRSAAVTFDDAFKNVHDAALPILKKYQIPATFFISTGYVGTQRLVWADRLEYLINHARSEAVELKPDDQKIHLPLTTKDQKIDAVTRIKAWLKSVGPKARYAFLDELAQSTHAPAYQGGIPDYENLDWNDVKNLDAPPHYEIGGHTVNHEILSYLDPEPLKFEIKQCLRDLQNAAGHPIDLFSYPEGQSPHFNNHVIETLKAYGVKICPTAISGVNEEGQDPFHLRRIMVGFMGEKFPFPHLHSK